MNGDNKSHMIVSWQERENRKVLSHCLKTASDGADATWRGRSFQTVAPETGIARLPTVERRTGGTSRRCEVEDRSRHLDVMSETRVKHDREVPWMDRYRRVITFSLKEMHSGTRSQWRLMRAEAMCSENYPSCSVLNRLETLDEVSRESKQDANPTGLAFVAFVQQ